MKNQYCINYTPAFSHPIATAMLFILSLITLMVLLASTTTFIRYGYTLPVLFHAFPVMLLVLLGTRISLKQNEQGAYDYRLSVFGVGVLTKVFVRVCAVERGKLYTLVGHTQNGSPSNTYITEPAAMAHLIFSRFTTSDTPSVT